MTTIKELTIADLLHGIPLGERRSSQVPTKAALADLGLSRLDPSTISKFRKVDTNGKFDVSGKFLVRAAEIWEILRLNDGSFKIDLYELIARLGIKVREPQQIRPERWSSVGFTERLSENIGLRLPYLGKIINAMRLDIVYHTISDPNSLPDNLLQTFYSCTEKYFSDYDPKNDDNKSTVYEIKAYWDGVSIPSFYQALIKRNNPRVTGTWGPYEMDTLFKYYKGLELQNYPLTPLDNFILEERGKGTTHAKTASRLKKQSSTDVSSATLILHTNALIGRYDPLTRANN